MTSEPPQESAYLLAPLNGLPAPRSPWLAAALGDEPERRMFDCAGAAIELLLWGELGKPGLLLLHGNGAHADWWRFIAPALANDYRVAAISWSGMGGSEWRSSYSLAGFATEILRALEEARLADGGTRPILIGHSFGGVPLLRAAVDHPDLIGGGILIDSMVRRPNNRPSWMSARTEMPVYPTIAAALARFRFAPAQSAEHIDIVDFIARRSLREVAGGWAWRFDPELWSKLDRSGTETLLDEVRIPIALLYGERSSIVDRTSIADASDRIADCRMAVEIPAAAHHVLVDQPIALIATLRAAVACLELPGWDNSRRTDAVHLDKGPK